MNVIKIRQEFEQNYPGKFIVENKIEEVVTEIVCETEPTSEHPEYSKAIAVIDKSRLHYHKKLTETYKILKGTLILHINDSVVELKEGDVYAIQPNTIHWAEGNETWLEVSSTPGWTIDDHIIIST